MLWAVPEEQRDELLRNDPERLCSLVRNPHLIFLDVLAATTTHIEQNKNLIEKVFGCFLSDADIDIYAHLRRTPFGRRPA